MKLKKRLITGVLAGAMLALPLTATAFVEPANNVNSNYVERVDWHHYYNGYRYDRGYYGNGYYGRRYYGTPYAYGYGRGYGACGNAARLQNQAARDRWTGHPAAAADVAQQARWARARCY